MSSEIGTIVVLAGGLSHERDVSLRSGRRVAQALRDRGHDVVESDVTAGLADLLTTTPDPVVFPVLHGGDGEDGALRTVLDLLGVPYVGSSGPASRIIASLRRRLARASGQRRRRCRRAGSGGRGTAG